MVEAIGLDASVLRPRAEHQSWPALRKPSSEQFPTRTRQQWCDDLEHYLDICFALGLDLVEAPEHPHLRAPGTFVTDDSAIQSAPVPRFDRTPGRIQRPPDQENTGEVIKEWLNLADETVARLTSAHIIA